MTTCPGLPGMWDLVLKVGKAGAKQDWFELPRAQLDSVVPLIPTPTYLTGSFSQSPDPATKLACVDSLEGSSGCRRSHPHLILVHQFSLTHCSSCDTSQ